MDESREQTERIHALQREARTLAGLARKAQRDELLALHRAAQRALAAAAGLEPLRASNYVPRRPARARGATTRNICR